MSMRPLLAILAVLSLSASNVPLATAGSTPAQKCAASKLKAAAKEGSGQLKCYAKAQGKGLSVDGLCLDKAHTKLLDSFDKADAKGGCLQTGDAPAVDSAVAAFVADAVSALGTGSANACAAAKEKATGKKFSSKLLCHAKAVLKGVTADMDCLDKAEQKFQLAFSKADDKGGCVNPGDASDVEMLVVDAGVLAVLGEVPTGTTTTSSTTTSTTTTTMAGPVSFATDVQPIFTANCALSGCHAGAFPAQGMNLSAGVAYANLVGVTSVECPTFQRVAAGAPSSSYVIFKLQGSGPCFGGSRMPLFADPLPDAQIQTISNWIAQGALNN